jgi:threonine synthase
MAYDDNLDGKAYQRIAARVSAAQQTREPLSETFRNRDIKLVIWAAKCHIHSRATGMPLGKSLIHSDAEILGAIERLERVPGYYNEPATDEGVRAHNKGA